MAAFCAASTIRGRRMSGRRRNCHAIAPRRDARRLRLPNRSAERSLIESRDPGQRLPGAGVFDSDCDFRSPEHNACGGDLSSLPRRHGRGLSPRADFRGLRGRGDAAAWRRARDLVAVAPPYRGATTQGGAGAGERARSLSGAGFYCIEYDTNSAYRNARFQRRNIVRT